MTVRSSIAHVGTRLLGAESPPVRADDLADYGEMSPRTHAIVLIATAVCIVFIVRLVRRHGLRSKYSLLWLTMAVPLAALGVFPGLLVAASRVVGIHYPPAAFLAVAVAFLFLVVIHFSWELSRLEERTRILAESAALLDAELHRLRTSGPAEAEGGTGVGDHGEGGEGDGERAVDVPAERSTAAK